MNNIETTQAIFAAFGTGDIPAILEHLADDIVIEFYGLFSLHAITHRR